MTDYSDPRLISRLQMLSATSAVFSCAVGLSGLAGWMLQLRWLTTWGATPVPMKANAALCMVLLGLSLWLVRKNGCQRVSPLRRVLGGTAAAGATALGLLRLTEHRLGWSFGIDEWWMAHHSAASIADHHAGIMTPVAAGAFICFGVSLLAVDWPTPTGQWLSQALALSAGLAGACEILSFSVEPQVYSDRLSLALPAAVVLPILALGTVSARTRSGVGALLCSQGLGASVARRLLPALLIPLLLGWTRENLRASGLFSEWSAVALTALTGMALLAVQIAWVAVVLERHDAARREGEQALQQSESKVSGIIQSAMDAILTVNADQRIVVFNPAAEQMFGRSAANTIGHSLNELMPARFHSAHAANVSAFAESTETSRRMGGQSSVSGLRADGTEFPAEISISQIEVKRRRLFTAIVRDITERKRAEEALRLSEDRLRHLVNASSDVIYRMSADWSEMYQLDGRGFIADTGTPSKDWLQTYIHPDDQALVTQAVEHAIQNKTVFELEHRVRKADGTLGWTFSRAVPRLDAKGEILDWIGMAGDVTRRKHAEEDLRESEQRLRLFIEYAPAALAMFDRDMRYLQVSRRWLSDYGLTARDVIGLSHYKLFPDLPERWKEIHRRGLVGEVLRSENDRFERADGSVQWIKWEIRPWYETGGKIGGIVIFAEDITERKQAEDEISRKAEDLARSNRDLEQFAYVASHDLQEPLRMVTAYTQLLAERYRGSLDANADKYIAYVVEGTARMQTLIQDLLAFSRIGRNGRERQSLDLGNVVDEAAENLKASILESRAVLTLAKLPLVHAERSQLVQLFQNLIGNAIKFHGENEPRISISGERHGRECVFAVTDNGIGIAAEHRERVFEIFQRLHVRAEYPGNGIGLSICKKIVEQHGGRIWVESEPGRGSTFRFILPAAAPISARSQKENANVYAASAPNSVGG